MMGFNLVYGSFAIIAVAALLQCAECVFRTGPILAGDNTPIWTAHCPYDKCNKKDKLVTYTKLDNGAVKRAIEFMKSTFKSLTYLPKRHMRSVELLDESHLVSLPSSGNRLRRHSAYQRGIVQILLVVDYDTTGVTDDASREKYINEKILYVLAYWRSFNAIVARVTSMKNWFKVTVNLNGIIINLNRAAAPYLNSSLTPQEALSQSNSYWSSPPHSDFTPRNGYHAVATMTDTRRSVATNGYFESIVLGNRGSSGTIIVWDNLAFRAVRDMATISAYQQCVNTLNTWSLRHVKIPDYMQPGNPVEAVLPGRLLTSEQQCAAHGYHDLERVCPERSKSCEIYCQAKHWYNIIKSSCKSIGKALEGTPCVDGKVYGTADATNKN